MDQNAQILENIALFLKMKGKMQKNEYPNAHRAKLLQRQDDNCP
jgi:hypothetical protein